jgi:arylsulfatase
MKNLLFLACLFTLISCSTSEQKNSKPNIILFFCDDLGYGDLGVYGHPTIKTPNLDRMAAQGLKFTNFYSGSPACTASRYALLTGRYPIRSGFPWVLYPNSSRGIHPNEWTLAEGLKAGGYATGCFGKWHLGTTKKEYLPLQNGFDEYLGLPYSNDMIPPIHPEIALMDGNDTLELSPDQTTLTRRYTERAIEFIQKKKGAPFFVYLPYAMPHLPLHPGAEFVGKSKRGTYGDVVEEIDWSVGEIWKKVEELGMAENTLLVFTSDNGPWIIKNEKGGSSGLFRDGKGSTWEGGMRVPAIAYWKGKIEEGSVCQYPSSTLDLYHSFLKISGQSLPENIVDGKDVSDWLSGGMTDAEAAEKPYFFYGPRKLHAVRKGAWKLHIHTSSQTGKDYFEGKLPLLFNIENDPSEQYELSESHPEIVEDLMNEIEAHLKNVEDNPNFFEQERLKQKINHFAVGKSVEFLSPLSQKYNSPTALTDGVKESADFYSYLPGIQEKDFEFVIDLEEEKTLKKIEIGFIQLVNNWIFLPEYVDFFISANGTNWEKMGTQTHEIELKEAQTVKYFTQEIPEKEARFIKVIAKNIGKCPEWHTGANQGAWLFSDEVLVE